MPREVTVGVLALQGAFIEHIRLLEKAVDQFDSSNISNTWRFLEVRTTTDLAQCDGLIIPGGESTTVSLVAARSGLLDPLRDFVKLQRKPTWGTCAGLILLAESANRTKQGGQDLIGGLDIRVNRNHFGRQAESFQTPLYLPFLQENESDGIGRADEFDGVFIRAPVVEKLLPSGISGQLEEAALDDTVVAPARSQQDEPVQVLATLQGRTNVQVGSSETTDITSGHTGDIVAVKQGSVFGTSFHPELTTDPRIHAWWLREVEKVVTMTD